MLTTLLATKLYIPPYRADLVSRPRLLQKLNDSLAPGRKLTLVSAPPGFGKTTLVLEWLQIAQAAQGAPFRKVSWLSLDKGDNDLAVFLTYLIAALQASAASIGRTSQQMLENNPQAGVNELLPPLINDLVRDSEPIVLVLDDYHAIQQPEIHEAVAFLLEKQPPHMHVVVTTRHDPLLPLARWRARGQLTEVRLNDLRFTEEEAAAFLTHTMQLSLRAEEIAALETRTEGWIAGLQLAAVSLHQFSEAGGGETPAGFVQAFAGDDRYVMDYLIDEVCCRQSNEVEDFLLYTSILERFNASLCEAVYQPPCSSTQSILEFIDRSNLFLIHLDNRREWYRYHQLFAELLRHRLVEEKGSQLSAELHRRAARWFASNNLTGEAVYHAAEAKDFDWLADLLEKAAQSPLTWSRGEINQLKRWLHRLPANFIDGRPELSIHMARACYLTGDIDEGLEWLNKTEAVVAAWPPSAKKDAMLGIIASAHATVAMTIEDIQGTITWAEKALRLLPENDAIWLPRTLYAVGLGKEETGDLPAAREKYEQVVELSLRTGNVFGALNGMGSLAVLLNRMGQLSQAEQVCRRGLELCTGDGKDSSPAGLAPTAGMMQIPLAQILFEHNQLEAAEKLFLEAIALAEQGGIAFLISTDIWLPMVVSARQGLGNYSAARQAFRQFESYLSSRYTTPHQRVSYQAQLAQLSLELNDTAAASAWARQYEQMEKREYILENPDLVLARVYLAEKRPAEALALLERLIPAAESGSFGRNLIEMLLLQGEALQALNQAEAAQAAIQRAIEKATPEGFIRLFTAEGGILNGLLENARQVTSDLRQAEFIDTVLASIYKEESTLSLAGVQRAPPAEPLKRSPQNRALVEPLTERELEVLRLIGEGLSNAEIARKLFLSTNTLKAHTQNIYSKLDVHSRVQVVNRARELGLI